MKISFSTLGCPRWTWREITSAAVDLNYQGIEMRGIGRASYSRIPPPAIGSSA